MKTNKKGSASGLELPVSTKNLYIFTVNIPKESKALKSDKSIMIEISKIHSGTISCGIDLNKALGLNKETNKSFSVLTVLPKQIQGLSKNALLGNPAFYNTPIPLTQLPLVKDMHLSKISAPEKIVHALGGLLTIDDVYAASVNNQYFIAIDYADYLRIKGWDISAGKHAGNI